MFYCNLKLKTVFYMTIRDRFAWKGHASQLTWVFCLRPANGIEILPSELEGNCYLLISVYSAGSRMKWLKVCG